MASITQDPPAVERVDGRLHLLDAVRLVAALMVVGFHWTFNGIVNGKVTSISLTPVSHLTQYGYWGVTLFFLISGFVIGNSARGKTVRQYVRSRLTRLFPAFWAAVLITGSVELVVRQTGMTVTPLQILVNLTMVPSLFGVPFVDGVYWTLEYELTFYLVVLVAVALRQGRDLLPIAVGWVLLSGIAQAWLGPGDLPFLLGRPFPAFASGVILATIVASGWTWVRAIGLAAGIVTTVGSELWYSRLLESYSGRDYSSALVVCLITSFFAVLMIQAIPRVRQMSIPGSRAAGDLTYPVYLIHAHLGYMTLNAVATDDNVMLVYPVMLAVLLGAAWLLHRVVEVAMAGFWRQFFDHRMAAPLDRLLAPLAWRPAGAHSTKRPAA